MKFRLRLSVVIVAVCAICLGLNIARAVFAQSPTAVRDADKKGAARVLAPPGGALDERLAVPNGDYVGGNGIVEPSDRETKVAADVSGRIAEVRVKEGDRVEQGAVLVALESGTETAGLAAAEADVKAADADLLRTLHGNRKEDVQAALADADSATARANQSAGVAERLEAAAKGGGATPDEVDRAAKQADIDRANAALSDAKRRAAVSGSRFEDVLAARARLAAAEARRDQARAALDQRSVHAPISGEILQSKFRAGEFYQAGGSEPLVVMGDTRQLRARVDVDERDIGRLRPDAAAIVRVPAFPGEDFRGKVVEIGRHMGRKNVRTDDPVERNDTKILEVVVALDPTERLVVGQRVMGYIAANSSPSRQ
jgi:multidrug resistance efflux pump